MQFNQLNYLGQNVTEAFASVASTVATALLSAVNGLSRLTKPTTSKGEGMADSKIVESANQFRIGRPIGI